LAFARLSARRTSNLHLIPSNLRLYNLEYEIAGHMARNQNMEIIDLIAQAIDEVVEAMW
jgi:chromosome partitioning protein